MYFSKTFPLCLSLFVHTTAASPVDISTDLSIRELSANITARDASSNDRQTRGAAVSAPQPLQDAAGSTPLGARSLFHKNKPVRCMGNTGFFCEKNCACTKGGSVSCEKLSKAEVKKWKKLHKDDETVTLEEHASQITNKCAGVCSCSGNKLPGTKVRKIGLQLGYGDMKAAVYHVTEKDTRGHAPPPGSAPGDPHVMPPSAVPAPPGSHLQDPAIDSYEADAYSPSLQRRGTAASVLKDPRVAGRSLNSKERTPPSCKGSRPVCQGHCYCTPSGDLTCDNLARAQKKSFGPEAVEEHAKTVKTACEPWCECKGKGKDWVEGKTLTEFNYGAGRIGKSENPKSISSSDPVDLTSTGGSERDPDNSVGSLSVDRGHLRIPDVSSSPATSPDDPTPDLSSTASPNLSLGRRGNSASSPNAHGYTNLDSDPDHLPDFHQEPIKCASTWGTMCISHCHCTRQGTLACDHLPENTAKLLKSRPDAQQEKADYLANVLEKCKKCCGCKDRHGVYRIEGRTFEEWKAFIYASPFSTPHTRASAQAPAAGASSPSTPHGRGATSLHSGPAGGSPALSSPPPDTDTAVASPPLSPGHSPFGKPLIHPRGVVLSADNKATTSSLKTSSGGSRSNTLDCSNKIGQKAFCEARCHCTDGGKVLCGKQKDGTITAVTQPGMDGCLNDCRCIGEGEKGREGWGPWKLPGGGRGLTRGPAIPEYPTNRPDYTVGAPEPRAITPLRQPPPRVLSSLNRQFPTFNQHSSHVLHPRGSAGSKLREKMSWKQKLLCYPAMRELCETKYTCDATGMIINRRHGFKAMCTGLACGATPKLSGTPDTISQCKQACLCVTKLGRELRQIGNTGEQWGGFHNPGQRGVSRRIHQITERNEGSPAAEVSSSSQATGPIKALHARSGAGNAIKNKLSPARRKLICEGEPKGPCESIYSCDKNGAMTRKCSLGGRCIILPEDEHTAAECKAACLCTDFKNDRLMRQIGTTDEEWGGFKGGVDPLTSKRMNSEKLKKANGKAGGVQVLGYGSIPPASGHPAYPVTLQRRGMISNIKAGVPLFNPKIFCAPRGSPQATFCNQEYKCNLKSMLVCRRGSCLSFGQSKAAQGSDIPYDISQCRHICGCLGRDGKLRKEGRVLDLRQHGNRGLRRPAASSSTPTPLERRGGVASSIKGKSDPNPELECSVFPEGYPGNLFCSKKYECDRDMFVVPRKKIYNPISRPKHRVNARDGFDCEKLCGCRDQHGRYKKWGGRPWKRDESLARLNTITSSPILDKRALEGNKLEAREENSALQRGNIQERGGSPRGASDSLDTAASSTAIPGAQSLKSPILCEGKDKSFCEERCYCTPKGTMKCGSTATFEDLSVLASPPMHRLDAKVFKNVKARYHPHVIGRCITPICKCNEDHGFRDPIKGLRKALSVIPSQPPSIRPRSGTDLVNTVPSSTPAAGTKPRSGTDLGKPTTTSPASTGNSQRREPIVCRGPQQNQCEQQCYCTVRGVVRCNKASTADEMHGVMIDPRYAYLQRLTVTEKTNLLTTHVNQRTKDCVLSCSCDGGKSFGKHGDLGWLINPIQRLARPDQWRPRSSPKGGKEGSHLSSIQERSVSLVTRGNRSNDASVQPPAETPKLSSPSADNSHPPKLLMPRTGKGPTVRTAFPLPAAGAATPGRRPVCKVRDTSTCDAHCICSEDGKLMCNEATARREMLDTLAHPSATSISEKEKQNLIRQHIFQVKVTCTDACSCDGGKTFGDKKRRLEDATPGLRPPTVRKHSDDADWEKVRKMNEEKEMREQSWRGRRIYANSLPPLPPSQGSQRIVSNSLLRQGPQGQQPQPFDRPLPAPFPRMAQPPTSRPQQSQPQRQTLFRPTPVRLLPLVNPPQAYAISLPQGQGHPVRGRPAQGPPSQLHPMVWPPPLGPQGLPLFRPHGTPSQATPPQAPPPQTQAQQALSPQLDPVLQYQNQPKYRHIYEQLDRQPQRLPDEYHQNQ
ncbi:hypothetical protein MMC30_008117 [Trapelia coarctata]|nr:hypothetical protein [Trapelia coarctata]